MLSVSLHEEARSFLFRRADEYIDSSAWHISNLYPLQMFVSMSDIRYAIESVFLVSGATLSASNSDTCRTWLLSKFRHVLISAAQVYILTATHVNRVSLCQPNDALLWHRTITRVPHTGTLCRCMLCTHHLHWAK